MMIQRGKLPGFARSSARNSKRTLWLASRNEMGRITGCNEFMGREKMVTVQTVSNNEGVGPAW